MKVLVVGGARKVGAMFTDTLAAAHDVVVANVVRGVHDEPFVRADVTDDDSIRAALQGQEAVIYLSMGPHDWRRASRIGMLQAVASCME